MHTEYHVTYRKVYNPDFPAATARHIYSSLEEALWKYQKMVEWDQRVPAACITDLKLWKRTYTEEDITPTA